MRESIINGYLIIERNLPNEDQVNKLIQDVNNHFKYKYNIKKEKPTSEDLSQINCTTGRRKRKDKNEN